MMRFSPPWALAAIAAATLLAGCGGDADAPANNATAQAAPKPKPLSVTDPEAYKGDPSTAMREVPEASRQDIQRLIVCRVNRAREEGKPIALDADVIRDLTEKLRGGMTVEDACRA